MLREYKNDPKCVGERGTSITEKFSGTVLCRPELIIGDAGTELGSLRAIGMTRSRKNRLVAMLTLQREMGPIIVIHSTEMLTCIHTYILLLI